MMTRLFSLALVVLLGSADVALAQTMTDVDNVVRAEIRTRKSAIMAKAMGLNTAQGDVFWPLYRAYESELDKLNDARMANIRNFADNYESMTDKVAGELAKQAFKVDGERIALLEKYYKTLSKELGPLKAVRFAQVENQLNTLIKFEMMKQIPLIATPEDLGLQPPAK
jgi:hypothetical protein